MRVYKWREDITADDLTDKEVIEMKLNKLNSITIFQLANGNNIRIKHEYVFDGGEGISVGGSQTVTSCTEASAGGVYTCTANGFAVGDIVTVRGQRSPDPSVAATFLTGFAVERGTITARTTDTFTIAEHSTAGAGTFAGTGTVTYEAHKITLATVNLTADSPETTTYDNKYGHIIVTRGDTGSTPTAGILRIDATAS